MNSLPRFTAVLVSESAPGLSLIPLVLVCWLFCLVWFLVFGSGLVLI